MDVAAFKVSHSVDISATILWAAIDRDATALRAARARSSSIHWGTGRKV